MGMKYYILFFFLCVGVRGEVFSQVNNSTFNSSQRFVFYPNPASTFLNYNSSYEIDLVNIYSQTGQLELRFATKGNSGRLPISTLNQGIYYLMACNYLGEIIVSKKFIVKH